MAPVFSRTFTAVSTLFATATSISMYTSRIKTQTRTTSSQASLDAAAGMQSLASPSFLTTDRCPLASEQNTAKALSLAPTSTPKPTPKPPKLPKHPTTATATATATARLSTPKPHPHARAHPYPYSASPIKEEVKWERQLQAPCAGFCLGHEGRKRGGEEVEVESESGKSGSRRMPGAWPGGEG
ncbi:hypothetical protein MMC11_003105 [Xylographa trunciseda]|nr:hypothetical protein [Xylographa trunciseda]